MSDSYYRIALENAQLEQVNAQLQRKCLAMACFLCARKPTIEQRTDAIKAARAFVGLDIPAKKKAVAA